MGKVTSPPAATASCSTAYSAPAFSTPAFSMSASDATSHSFFPQARDESHMDSVAEARAEGKSLYEELHVKRRKLPGQAVIRCKALGSDLLLPEPPAAPSEDSPPSSPGPSGLAEGRSAFRGSSLPPIRKASLRPSRGRV